MVPDPDRPAPTFVSTGSLPADDVQAIIDDVHRRHRANDDGDVSSVYPALAAAPRDLFGISLVSTTGGVYEAGDVDTSFTIMSVSKPFVFALVCSLLGPEATHAALGVNATGLPFNSLDAIEASPDGRTNPMVNPGAIAATNLVPGTTMEARWAFIHDGLSRFAGRDLTVHDEVYRSATTTNQVNREIVARLVARGRIAGDPAEALDLYTRQCSLVVTAHDLAVMGATLADGGVNPVTGERVIDARVCHSTLAVMLTAGLYETSGDWLYAVGAPAKSGIGGGIVTVAPGKGGLGTFAPPLDGAGNSIKGQLVARDLARRLGLDLLASSPPS